jgi:glutamine amidotransferase
MLTVRRPAVNKIVRAEAGGTRLGAAAKLYLFALFACGPPLPEPHVCRLLAFRANQPTRVRAALVTADHSLLRQSCGDRRGECHGDGWGVGHFLGLHPVVTRSVRPAATDPLYRSLAEELAATTLLAHVRQASAGPVAERNCHPFRHGRWLFAHNGTLQGFAAAPERLFPLVPAHLRGLVAGETDSEHAFYFVLGLLEQAAGAADGAPDAGTVGRTLAEAVARLAVLFPGSDAEPTRLNFVLTDGRVLAASRWGHTLYRAERRRAAGPDGDGPVQASPDYRAVIIASEPTSPEGPWAEVPDRTVLTVDEDLRCALAPIPA